MSLIICYNRGNKVIGWMISPDMNPHYSQLLSKLLGEMRQRAHKRGIQTHVVEEAYTSQNIHIK